MHLEKLNQFFNQIFYRPALCALANKSYGNQTMSNETMI